MKYEESKPCTKLSHHVESFWELTASPEELSCKMEMLPPDCTFDMVFSPEKFRLEFIAQKTNLTIDKGATFLGQRTGTVSFDISKPLRLFGIRFKPFAFAKIIDAPLHFFNDNAIPIHSISQFKNVDHSIVQALCDEPDFNAKVEVAESFILQLFQHSFAIDEKLRAQTNYILDHKGIVKVADIIAGFTTTKTTLRKHFINKMGLAPKQVSRIWRINYFLELKKENSSEKLTELCLEAGYYDQAHFIKEFKSFFNYCPRYIFKANSQLLKISQETIARRFSNHYDPH